MGAGTKEDNRAFARKMTEQIKQAQENECDSCPHKPTCTWYISEHREQLAAMLAEAVASNYIGTPLEGLDAYGRQLKRFEIKPR